MSSSSVCVPGDALIAALLAWEVTAGVRLVPGARGSICRDAHGWRSPRPKPSIQASGEGEGSDNLVIHRDVHERPDGRRAHGTLVVFQELHEEGNSVLLPSKQR